MEKVIHLQSTRNSRIDIIKGIGILLIVLGHTQMSLESFVSLFHVGLFFIASGYCYKEIYSDDISKFRIFLIKRIKRLYLPYVMWNLGYLSFRNFFSSIGIYDNASIGLKTFIVRAAKMLLLAAGEQLAGACWFVRALFVLEVLFVLSDGIIKWSCRGIYRRICRWMVAIGMLLLGAWLNREGIVIKYYNIGTICSVWILYVAGLECKNYIEKKGLEWETNIKRFVLFFFCNFVLIGLNTAGSINYSVNRYPNLFFFLMAAGAGWGVIWNLAGLIEQFLPWLERIFVYIGRRTMTILFLHLLCFKLVSVLYVVFNDMERSAISAFPVITNEWWLFYLIVGVGVPLMLCAVWEVCTGKIREYGKAG